MPKIVQIVITKTKTGRYKISAMSETNTEEVYEGDSDTSEVVLHMLIASLQHVN